MWANSGIPFYSTCDKQYGEAYKQKDGFREYKPEREAQAKEIKRFVSAFELRGKDIAEFGCGEGISGEIMAGMGCRYMGYDMSPTAVEKASSLLKKYENAKVTVWDITRTPFARRSFDAAIDMSCLHMLVVDDDRRAYLSNAFHSLKQGAFMVFYGQAYKENAYGGIVHSQEEWLQLSGESNTKLPLIVLRPMSVEGYRDEMKVAGFEVVEITHCDRWAKILVMKPWE